MGVKPVAQNDCPINRKKALFDRQLATQLKPCRRYLNAIKVLAIQSIFL